MGVGTLIVMELLRVSEIVELPDGTFVHPFAVWAALKLHDAVLRYQLVQHKPTGFELRLVTVDRPTFDAIVPKVVADLRTTLGGAVVDASHHEHLEQGRGGKFRPVVALPRS